jgi:hypothetical protein
VGQITVSQRYTDIEQQVRNGEGSDRYKDIKHVCVATFRKFKYTHLEERQAKHYFR